MFQDNFNSFPAFQDQPLRYDGYYSLNQYDPYSLAMPFSSVPALQPLEMENEIETIIGSEGEVSGPLSLECQQFLEELSTPDSIEKVAPASKESELESTECHTVPATYKKRKDVIYKGLLRKCRKEY